MDFLNSWLQGIIVAVIISTIIEMILPNGNSKKYIKIVLGIYVVFNIITPIINKCVNSNFELSSILNIEEYMKKMETYEVDSKNINKSNEDNIKQIYISNLKTDMKTKLEEKGYKVEQIEIKIEDNESYMINGISISIKKKQEDEQENIIENKIVINEIEKVEIQIGENKENNIVKKSDISESEKKQIKEYLVSVYEVKEKQINIY